MRGCPIARAAAGLLASLIVRVHVYSLAKLMGYRRYEPQRDTILTVLTNGLGTSTSRACWRCCRMQGSSSCDCAGEGAEGPKYKLDSLKAAFPRATFYNLNFEVDYDIPGSFNNLHIAARRRRW